MSTFKVGEEVVCISTDYYRLNPSCPQPHDPHDPKVGLVYEIREVWMGCLGLKGCPEQWYYEEICFERLINTDELMEAIKLEEVTA